MGADSNPLLLMGAHTNKHGWSLLCPNHSQAEAGGRVVDSLINYETVKYFGNEQHEVGARWSVHVDTLMRCLISRHAALCWPRCAPLLQAEGFS